MNKKGFTLIELMIVIAIIAILAAILVPNFLRARAQGQYTACASNLRNVATALEMYATDHTGRYPADLGDIKPDYLRQVPECPSAGDDTFTDAY
ncbi:MAG: prepilin-type N-terminal cleavage/methylation domain-containing protein, partial [Vulcanimicrobiota bacterium]